MPNKKSFFIVMAAFISLSIFSCSGKDDTVAIRKLIERGAELAEKHEIGDLMRLTTDGFTAFPGSHDARSVRGILFVAFEHYGTFNIRYPRPSVEVEKDATTARAAIYFMIVSQDRAMPELKDLYENPQEWLNQASEKADLYQLKLDLIKKSGDWRVEKAELAAFKGLSF